MPLLQTINMDGPAKWAVAVLVILTMLYAVMRPMRKRKDPLAHAPSQGSLAQQRAFERQMSDLLVELEEMARQMTAQLDTRSAKLELLIKEADEKIAMIQAAAEPASSGARSVAAAAHAADADAPRPSASEPRPDPRHLEVYALADQGHSPRHIAQQLGRPHGEIELILHLRAESMDAAEPVEAAVERGR